MEAILEGPVDQEVEAMEEVEDTVVQVVMGEADQLLDLRQAARLLQDLEVVDIVVTEDTEVQEIMVEEPNSL